MRRRIDPDPRFLACLAALGESREALDGLWALTLYAVRTPEKGGYIEEQDVWMIYSRTDGDHPALRLYYQFDEEVVVLLWVERWEG